MRKNKAFYHKEYLKNETMEKEHSLKDKVIRMSELPKDVVLGVPTLTMTGQMELNIENYRGILEYTDCLVRVQTKSGQLKVCGTSLQVEYYRNDEMKVIGCITSIEYLQ